MDAVITSVTDGIICLGKIALDLVAKKACEATMEQAPKYWAKAKALLGMTADPAPDKLDETVRTAIENVPETHERLRELLEDFKQKHPGQMVGSIDVGRGVVSVVEKNNGTINANPTFN